MTCFDSASATEATYYHWMNLDVCRAPYCCMLLLEEETQHPLRFRNLMDRYLASVLARSTLDTLKAILWSEASTTRQQIDGDKSIPFLY